jgi:hypothetical protein
MDKRILTLGCICAVAILIGVSFTSVVGYSSNNSNSVRASPLFNLRTNRAIDNGEDVTTCDYVGKGKQSTISIPTIDNKIVLMIHRIKYMDSKSFDKLKLSVIKQVRYNDDIKNEDLSKIILLLNQIRDEPLDFTDKTDCTTKPFKIFCEIVEGFAVVLTMYILVILITLVILKTIIEQDCFISLIGTCSTDGCPSYCLWTCIGGACTVHETNCPEC